MCVPLPAETSREAPKCCAWQHQEGGPETRSGTVQVLLPAETALRGGGPETRSGTVQPRGSQVLRLAASRGGVPSAAPGSKGPETRSGTVQSLKCCIKRGARLKCCPCQQKRAARLPSAAPGSIKGGGPRNALGYRPEPEVLPLPETSREAPKCCAWQHQGGGPRNALGHRPEPEVLPLPAETSREAPKCCAWQHQGGGGPNQVLRLAASREGAWQHQEGGPKRARVLFRAETSREAAKCCAWQHQGGGPKRARVPSRA